MRPVGIDKETGRPKPRLCTDGRVTQCNVNVGTWRRQGTAWVYVSAMDRCTYYQSSREGIQRFITAHYDNWLDSMTRKRHG